MWLTDPKTKKKSVTLTILVTTVGISLLKLLVSGMTIKGFNMATFTGTDFAAVVGVAAGLYWGRKQTDANKGK